MGRRQPDVNLTLRVDPDVLLWARMRALVRGTSVNAVIRRCLERYASVPEPWWEGRPWVERKAGMPDPEPNPLLAEEDR